MWVKVLVLWHVFCITVWTCPDPSNQILNGTIHPAPLALGDQIRLGTHNYLKPLTGVRAWLFTTGTWQYWDMFSPNPAFIDNYGDLVITYKDGTTKYVEYPRMYNLSIPEKYIKERYRKFYERAHDARTYPYIFIPFIYRQALENYTDPKNPPVRVALTAHSREVVDPGRVQPLAYKKDDYFTGEIDPVKLNQMAGIKP